MVFAGLTAVRYEDECFVDILYYYALLSLKKICISSMKYKAAD